MDRLSYLISKLNEEFSQNASHDDLLAITREIEKRLLDLKATAGKGLPSSRVSVVMPASSAGKHSLPVQTVQYSSQETVSKTDWQPPQPLSRQQKPAIPEPNNGGKEVNEVMSVPTSSVNDLLKNETLEVGHLLKEAPIRDLRKAIGVNDRYVFVNELFMGDDIAFEETVKTINSFRIHGEAIFWIEREVAGPLSWKPGNETVQHFLQLVRRRFL